MKPIIPALCLAFSLLVSTTVCATPSSSIDPAAFGVDLGATTAGAFMGAAALDISVDIPLARGWSLDLEPSGYWAAGSQSSVVQLDAVTLARFYLTSLFINGADRQSQWGFFIAGGAVAAWENIQGGSALDVLSIGPTFRLGYRLVFGDHGIFLEPALGWMALIGGRFEAGGVTPITNSGVTAGLTLGYRF